MSKIAVTSEGPGLDDLVDPRFGRAAGFVIVDLDTMDTSYIDNGQTQVLAQGAGIQAAQLVSGAGVDCVLSGFVGPKAFQALSAVKIKVVQNLDEGMTVRQAVEKFKSGVMQYADRPNRGAGQ
ncbi:MAG: NifB/NifX family molybdenum-iron cluster-binding protein [Syntrophobacteraceae bacterium]